MKTLLTRQASVKLYIFAIVLGIVSALLAPTNTLIGVYSSHWTTLIPQSALLCALLFYNTVNRPIYGLVAVRGKEFNVFLALGMVGIITTVGYYFALTLTYIMGGASLGPATALSGLLLVWGSRLLLLLIIALLAAMTFLVARSLGLIIVIIGLNFLYHYWIEMFVILPRIIGG